MNIPRDELSAVQVEGTSVFHRQAQWVTSYPDAHENNFSSQGKARPTPAEVTC